MSLSTNCAQKIEQRIDEVLSDLRIYMSAATIKNPLVMIDDFVRFRKEAGK